MNTEKIVSEYLEFVQKTIEEFSDIGHLIDGDEVTPQRVNYALSKYYDVSLALSSEYQRHKINHAVLETDHQIWWDEKFTIAKQNVLGEYENNRSIKPSVKEFETRLRRDNKDEWKGMELRLRESEARMRFLYRMRETLNQYDSILTTLSHNLRTELRAFSIGDRSNHDPATATRNKVRTRHPVS